MEADPAAEATLGQSKAKRFSSILCARSVSTYFLDIMAILTATVVWLLATAAAAESSAARLSSGEKIACSKLKSQYPDRTFLPGSSEYVYETQIREFSSPDQSLHAKVGQPTGPRLHIAHQLVYSLHKMPSRYPLLSPP